MKTIVQTAVATGLLFAVATGPFSVAQTASSPPASPGQGGASMGLILRGSDILNAKVFSQQGEELGHVRDFLLDPETGNISYAVLGMGGWQGIGEKYAIIPWQFIRQDEQKAENYILQTDREKFRTAPTFERDNWATVLQPGYLAKVHEHFSSPSPQQQQPQVSQAPAAPSPPVLTPDQKSPPEPQQKQQAQKRPRKETQQAEQKRRPASKSSATAGADDDSK